MILSLNKKWIFYPIVIGLILISMPAFLGTVHGAPQLPENATANVENVSENLSLELWPNATYHFSDNLSASARLENVTPENLPVENATWKLDYSILSENRLKIVADTSTTFSDSAMNYILDENWTYLGVNKELGYWFDNILDDENDVINLFLFDNQEGKKLSQINIDNWVENAVDLLPTNYAQVVENLAFDNAIIQGKNGMGHVVLENLICNKFDWNENVYKLDFDITIILENIGILDNSTYNSRFPLSENLNYSYDGENLNFSTMAMGDNDNFSMSLNATQNGPNWYGTTQIEASGDLPRASPSVALGDYQFVEVLFLPNSLVGGWTKVRQYWLDDSQVLMKLRCPENSTVSDLPSGEQIIGDNYFKWLDDNALDAGVSIIKQDYTPNIDFAVTEVTTKSATNISQSGANLRASIDYGGLDNVDVRFRYRKSGTSSWTYTSENTDYTSTSYSKSISGLDSGTTYEFQAKISGGWWHDYGGTKTFTTSAPPVNQPPTADAAGPYSVDEGETVELDGTGSSDPDGTITSYSWTITEDPTGEASLTEPDTATPTFHAPSVDENTDVTVELTVTDDDGATDSDTATVTVRAVVINQPPIADADGPYSVDEGKTVELDGTGSSDPDGDIVSYSWSITVDPTGEATLTESDTATPVFNAPLVDNDTNVTVELTVEDDDGATDNDSATVAVRALPPAPSPEVIENMTPENAAENLAGSDPENAARTLENVASESVGKIIDASVGKGLTDNVADILRRMDTYKAASAIISAETNSSARVIESIIGRDIDSAALITDNAAKRNLERAASIADNIETASLSDLLVEIYDLPETPKVAGDLLGAISTGKSIAVTQNLIESGKYAYVNGMFGYLSNEKLNDVWEGLTQEQKDALLPHLSSEVKDRIEALKPFPWEVVIGIIVVIIFIAIIILFFSRILYLRRGPSGGL